MIRSHAPRGFALAAAAALLLVPGITAAQPAVTIIHSFSASSPADGGFPESELIQAADGDFYGTTYAGGALGLGTVFKMTAAGAVTVLHSFAGSPNDGTQLRAALVQGRDGNFYGTTQGGGAFRLGTVFTMTPAGAVTVLHSFAGGADGSTPNAALIEGSDGNFYGTTTGGGAADAGTVFRMTPDGHLTLLHTFTDSNSSGPLTALVEATDGNFYGTTASGGASHDGTVFRMTAAGAVTVLHSFDRSANEGSEPMGTLIQAADGNFYGTTFSGGTFGHGTVYRVTPAGDVTVLHSFAGGALDGAYPWAGVIQGSDGNFYGTTEQGGPFDTGGTVFRMTPTGVLTVLHAFSHGPRGIGDAYGPTNALLQAADGSFYGVTDHGGAYGFGAAFRFDAVSCIDKLTLHYQPGSPNEGGTLYIGFTMRSTVPATWTNWIFYSGGSTRGSLPIPAVSPLAFFTVPLQGFHPVGWVGVYTALSTPAQGVMCGDLKFVNTGAGAAGETP